MALLMDRARIEAAEKSAGEPCDPPDRSALDVSLHDRELHDELVLTTELVIAANESPGRLSQERVDDILGVRPVGAAGAVCSSAGSASCACA